MFFLSKKSLICIMDKISRFIFTQRRNSLAYIFRMGLLTETDERFNAYTQREFGQYVSNSQIIEYILNSSWSNLYNSALAKKNILKVLKCKDL